MYDPDDFPNEADEMMARLQEKARASAKARKAGKCDHGWRQGCGGPGFPSRESMAVCLYCGKQATQGQMDDEAQEIYQEYC